MRIHTNAELGELMEAAKLARVDMQVSRHGSRSRGHAFEVKLEGESRRRPNGGAGRAGSGYAATWDQWGVFLAAIYQVDSTTKCWAYDGREEFNYKTANRFADGWPNDAHGDHTFRFSGTPREQECTKCTATTRW